jgi:predicted PurR-regulated permease PerM
MSQFVLARYLFAITLYYLYLNGVAWRERLVRVLPLDPNDTREFLRRFHLVSLGVLVGNLGTALVQGVVATIGFVLFGTPVPILFGLLTVFAALVPLVGSPLVWAPLAIYMGFTKGLPRGLEVALWGALLVSTVDNFVRPLLTRRGLELHTLVIFLAVFGGVATYGAAGVFLGPLVMAFGARPASSSARW